MQFLLDLDYWLFSKLNGLDPGMQIENLILSLRNKYLWIPLYVFVVAFLFFNFRAKIAYTKLLTIIVVISLTDLIGNNLFKKGFERLRPCNNLDLDATIFERIPCSSSFSFTSNHAANHFAIAVILILILPIVRNKIKLAALLWAAAICFAQVFAGVHYPSDVIGGALLGTFIAFSIYSIANYLDPKSMM